MGLSIKNTGIIILAKVDINGLTIIAGENDAGKSTIGKLMFSIVKAFSRFEQDFGENVEGVLISINEYYKKSYSI